MNIPARDPTLCDLLNQFETIGGPEEFGPEGLAIMVAIWRKSSKLNWSEQFTMTNTELSVQTGITTRKTLNAYRKKLVSAGLIDYDSPPNGSARGNYKITFNLLRPVTSGNRSEEKMSSDDEKAGPLPVTSGYRSAKPDPEPVTSGYSFSKPVTSGNSFGTTVLKDLKDLNNTTTTTTTTEIDIDQEFENVLQEFCIIHQKPDYQVKSTDIVLMQEMIALGVPTSLIVRVMKQIYDERTAKGRKITAFGYYKNAILEAWNTSKAITAGMPITGVALGSYPPERSASNERDQVNRSDDRHGRDKTPSGSSQGSSAGQGGYYDQFPGLIQSL